MAEVVGGRHVKSSILRSHREKGGGKLEEMMVCAKTHSSECVCVCIQKLQFLVYVIYIYMGFPGGLNGKEFTCNARDLDSIPIHTYVYKYKTLVSKVTTYICGCEC